MQRLAGPPSPNSLAAHVAEVGAVTGLLTWLLSLAVRLVWWLVRRPLRPLVVVLVLLAVSVISSGGEWFILGPLLGMLVIAVAWRRFWPRSFANRVAWPLRSARRRRRYGRAWRSAMVGSGLAFTDQGIEYLPRLRNAYAAPAGDLVTAQLLPGQTIADWSKRSEALARAFGVQECRVSASSSNVQIVHLWLATSDPLAEPIRPTAIPEDVDLTNVPVAIDEQGRPWGMPVLGSHTLVAGSTGAGKGSVLWSLIWGMGAAIRDNLVSVWALDPKGGMELAFGAPIFDRFAFGTGTPDGAASTAWQSDMADLLDDAVAVMQERAARLRGISRRHVPSPQEPLILIVVDEVASLTAYVTDRATKARIQAAVSLLLSQGRAVGVCLVLATQDARKEVLGMRDLIPLRIALRTSESEQADLILGRGAHERGAWTDQIPEQLPGVGYVLTEGSSEPVRVRFWHVTDDDIAGLVQWIASQRIPPGDDISGQQPAA